MQTAVVATFFAQLACGRFGYTLQDEESTDEQAEAATHPATSSTSGTGSGGGAGTSLGDSGPTEAEAGAGGTSATPNDAASEPPILADASAGIDAAPQEAGADASPDASVTGKDASADVSPLDVTIVDVASDKSVFDAKAIDSAIDSPRETAPPEAGAPADARSPDVGPPDAPKEAAIESGAAPRTIDDSVAGSGTDQFNYVGSGWLHCTGCAIGQTYYDMSDSWSDVTNDYVTFTFVGTQLKFYGVLDTLHGIGAISIDSGPETTIDFYNGARLGNQLLWTSPLLGNKVHTMKLRVTGQKNRNSTDFFVTVDRVDVQ